MRLGEPHAVREYSRFDMFTSSPVEGARLGSTKKGRTSNWIAEGRCVTLLDLN